MNERNETPKCPACGSANVEVLNDEAVAICNDCFLEWPYIRED